MGWPGIVVDWALQKPERWGESLATAGKLRERYGCPIWVSAEKDLIPLAIMSVRYMNNNYRWLQRHIDKAREQIVYYQGELAQADHRRAMEGAGIRYRFELHDRATGLATGATMTLNQQLADAQACLESWQEGERWMVYSVGVLRQWADEHGITLYDEVVA